MKNLYFICALVAVTLVISSCKKEDKETTTTAGKVEIHMAHRWENSTTNFLLNMELVHPMTNDTMTFTTFKYYVSNIKLKKADGTWYVHPESYFLVDLATTGSEILSIPNVPTGEYTDMEYTLGVDSLRNVSGAQSGALAVSNNMFWSWNSGYILVKAEGTSPNSTSGSFAFHLGGFMGNNNIVTSKSVNFSGNSLTIASGKTSEVHFNVNPAKLWLTASSMSTNNSIMMPGVTAKTMATDFYGGIEFDHIHE
jgi:hypothetical protein